MTEEEAINSVKGIKVKGFDFINTMIKATNNDNLLLDIIKDRIEEDKKKIETIYNQLED